MSSWEALGDLVRDAYEEGRDSHSVGVQLNPYDTESNDRVERLQARAWSEGRDNG